MTANQYCKIFFFKVVDPLLRKQAFLIVIPIVFESELQRNIEIIPKTCRYIFEVPLGEKLPPRQRPWGTKGAIQIVNGIKAYFN
jgi:hypothetical protein